jgi:hypothetical protein
MTDEAIAVVARLDGWSWNCRLSTGGIVCVKADNARAVTVAVTVTVAILCGVREVIVIVIAAVAVAVAVVVIE